MKDQQRHEVHRAPAIFSRYLDNPALAKALTEGSPKYPLRPVITELLKISDEINETWFSFSTNLSDKKEGIELILEAFRPFRIKIKEIFNALPPRLEKNIRPIIQHEELAFEQIINGIAQNAPDTMSAISGHYLNFIKYLEMLITSLTLLTESETHHP
ncbi:MAG: hypothetical protein IPJ69_02940 [Deltaproteobacteria bacterium]|nr:MAG: hypothetical protein IPJ69_02940 [Deltaproteobacteria bacterium]